MLTGSTIVKPADERPARRDGRCFYCSQPIGTEHKADCVTLSRTVVVKIEIDAVIKVPRDWDSKMIEFHRNDGTWCSNNLIADLADWQKRHEADGACICSGTRFTFVREAGQDDHDGMPVLHADADS